MEGVKRMFNNEKIKQFLNMEKPKNESSNDIYVYGTIGSSWWGESVSANDIKRKLENIKSGDIHLYVNSLGGSVFDGISIGNQLKRHSSKVIVHIDGIAASAASLIAMAGDEIIMPSNAMMMVHRASTFAWGNRDEFEKVLNSLDKIDKAVTNTYMSRFIGERSEMEGLLKNETWLTADEALAFGLCDTIIDEVEPNDHANNDDDPEVIKNNLLQKYAANAKPQEPAKPKEPQQQKNNITDLMMNYLNNK